MVRVSCMVRFEGVLPLHEPHLRLRFSTEVRDTIPVQSGDNTDPLKSLNVIVAAVIATLTIYKSRNK